VAAIRSRTHTARLLGGCTAGVVGLRRWGSFARLPPAAMPEPLDVNRPAAARPVNAVHMIPGYPPAPASRPSNPEDPAGAVVPKEARLTEFPRFLKRDLRSWAGSSYGKGEELCASVSHVVLVGLSLAGRVQGKNVLVQTGADGALVGKCTICRAWQSPTLAPVSHAAERLPHVALDGCHASTQPTKQKAPRGHGMCEHAIALLIYYLGEKAAINGASKPQLFDQLRGLGQVHRSAACRP
jgi:hypothetical protein